MRQALAILVTMLSSACSSAGPPAATVAASSSTPTTEVPVVTSVAPSATTTPAVRPAPTPVTELSQVFRPLATGWRPTSPTLVVARSNDTGETTLVALPIEAGSRGGAPVPIVTLAPGSWALRSDGGAVVIGVGQGTGRLAMWDVRSGAARWLTTADAGGGSPVWSKDGASIYYASSGANGKPGIFRVSVDGSDPKPLFTHERFGHLTGLTPDGNGLVWSRGQAGGSVDIFDIVTGENRHLEDNASVTSWRARQPRLLLQRGGCCAGRGGGSLVAWDDVTMTSRIVAEIGQYADPAWIGGAWDPTGTRIAAGRLDNAISREEPMLVILDPNTGATQPVPGTLGVRQIRWMPEGIVFALGGRRQGSSELMLLHDLSAPPVSLLKDAGYVVDVVRP